MGGSSSGGGRGGGGKSAPRDCMAEGKTQLASPQPTVLSLIVVGDELEIIATAGGGCNAVFQGQIAGAIVGIQLARLLECIGEGHEFVAVVRSIDGGRCAVTIKNIDS